MPIEKNSPPLMQDKLSKEEINQLPLVRYEGPVELVRSVEEEAEALEAISKENLLGVDTETRPSFKKGRSYLPSILQVATSDKVYLFCFKWYAVGKPVFGVLENPDIVKTGVALREDIAGLQKIRSFNPNGIVDLATVARQKSLKHSGLRGLAALFLHVRISKMEQCSNWASKDLTPRQITYAATDAWISREIFLSMESHGLVTRPLDPERGLQ
ncbi:hypothetical protein AAG570_014056 [Ranatra chinensis]|uniref:3'-5' exonuclease domain-containing protein n=1 Tax=Ranatra chinensis TaxID=642074 RepID=A0ABD0XS99_9HEMI